MFENCNVEITSKNDEKNDEKERRILKSDNLLDSEYVTYFWMRASGSEHMKRGYESDVYLDECSGGYEEMI